MSVAKATAAMTANQTPAQSNLEAQRQGFFDQCDQFGTNAGAGDTSKVGFFQATCEAAWQGIIAPSGRRKKGDTTMNDAETAYTRFTEARKKKAGELGKKLKASTERGVGDFNVRVAETNSMIQLGSLPLIHDTKQGGLGVFNRTLRIIRENEEIKGQVDDMLLKIARAQCGKPEHVLSDEEITKQLMPEEEPDKEPKAEVERWGSVLKTISKIREDFPETAGVNNKAKTVLNQVAAIVDDLGGTQAMIKAREKAREQEEKDKAARQVQRQGARKKKR